MQNRTLISKSSPYHMPNSLSNYAKFFDVELFAADNRAIVVTGAENQQNILADKVFFFLVMRPT